MCGIDQFKQKAKAVWSDFAVMESFTGAAAPRLVRFSGIGATDKILDVACGSGVVALAAASAGANVTGIDLTPQLISRANENAKILNLNIDFHEGDAEELPYENESFDAVLSQFGHMFAPRPSVTLSEMLRVLRPKGTIAFATWPPELFMGEFFKIVASYGSPLPERVSSPVVWGNVDTVNELLGSSVNEIKFDRDRLLMSGLSIPHLRHTLETGAGSLKSLTEALESEDLQKLRFEIDRAIANYFEDNYLRMDYLLTKAKKM